MPDVVLETSGLTKDFRKRRAVDGLSLSVFDGDVYGFLGPNGAGKSTTIRMLTGLVTPSAGSARLLGRDVRTHRLQAAKEVGALVELPAFYKYMSARENLRMLSALSGGCESRRIDEVLDIVGLLDRANDKVKSFSHGMQQRLGIAQALLPNPRLVILDEPTSGLDPQGMRDVRQLIQRLSEEEKVTVFLSSHLLHEVEQVCNRVGVINRGKLVAEGDVKDLVARASDVVDLRVDDAEKAVRAIHGIGLTDVSRSGNGQLTVRISPDKVAEMNAALVNAGVGVSALVPRAGTLEDLFLELVEEETRC